MNPNDSAPRLTHVDPEGAAKMVDVGGKENSLRTAIAQSRIRMSIEAANAIRENGLKKGDCLQVSRVAAIQATKWTSHLIPLCHPIPVDGVSVDSVWSDSCSLTWTVKVTSFGKTGVEMEAMTAASVAALTTYDMCKSIDPAISIVEVCLLSKSGGVRGDYHRETLADM